MLQLKREPDSCIDKYTVTIVLGRTFLTTWRSVYLSFFQEMLIHEINNGFAKVTGNAVNRGAGYGMEVPVVYYLYGPGPYGRRMKEH